MLPTSRPLIEANVATDTFGIDKLRHDNMLLVSLGDRFYRYRMETSDHRVSSVYLCSTWEPFKGIAITTYLSLSGSWFIRLHRIVSAVEFSTVEGGFALPYNDAAYPLPAGLQKITENEALWKTELGFSGIKNIGEKKAG